MQMVNFVLIYFIIGALFALWFVSLGVTRLDAAAKGASVGFRVLIGPGVVALWPLFVWRLWRNAKPPVERNPHRVAAQESQR